MHHTRSLISDNVCTPILAISLSDVAHIWDGVDESIHQYIYDEDDDVCGETREDTKGAK